MGGWILTKNEPSLRKPYDFGKRRWSWRGKRTHSWLHAVKWLVKTHCSHSLCHTMRTRVWQLGGICSSLQWQEAQSLGSVLYDWSSADTSYDVTWDCSMWVTQYISFHFKTFFMNGYFACMYVLCTTFVPGVLIGQKRVLQLLKWISMVVNHHMVARYWTSVLGNNSQCSQSWLHLSSP